MNKFALYQKCPLFLILNNIFFSVVTMHTHNSSCYLTLTVSHLCSSITLITKFIIIPEKHLQYHSIITTLGKEAYLH